MHLLAWQRVCRPKGDGGLGIVASAEMNTSLVAKVGWRLLHDETSLWAQVVRHKYKVGDVHDSSWLRVKSNWSVVWKSMITGLREVVFQGQSWVAGDGRRICFWTDKWLTDQPLEAFAVSELPANYELCTARDLWSHETGWRFDHIAPYVPENICLELRAIVLDCDTGAKDRLSWSASADGQFSVKSAFSLLTNDATPRPDMEVFFRRVWKIRVPERVKVFLWLVSHQVIMTNVERKRRHLCDSEVCSVCRGGFETIIHVLRDCPSILGIWNRIVPALVRRDFFFKSLLEWLFDNLQEDPADNVTPWTITFAMACWWAWKWRCGNVFGENRRCPDRVQFIKDFAREVWTANKRVANQSSGAAREERQIGWLPPPGDWFKLNTDGASRGNPGLATAGGVLRDAEGRWCRGFILNIGRCSAPLAELWGVYYGLVMAWEQRCLRVELEVDSELVVGFLQTGISDTHPLFFLVRLCHGLIAKDWLVRVSHVYREANCLADGLANYAFSFPLGFSYFDVVPFEVASLFEADVLGSTRPRRVRM
ncbi:unnamed protein product [Microthlaspi erraticum]|uniref:RNase H type-1 domain-containing protein n=1 Tax=Microthlaspi erraticum TaxID=1685480 RepID=A0A6D2HGU5_9BRAS|nr:unnamed protein product [Microthlaspi erraticum]